MLYKQNRWRIARIMVALGLAAFTMAAQADLYVYEMPDGTRMVSNHPISNKYYKLVRTGQTPKGIGALLASRNRQFFRADSSAYDSIIHQTAKRHRVDIALVKAIIHAESAFNPYAISNKGARGLMQLLPTTAAQYGIRDLYDPEQNIRAGVRHLKYLLKKYRYNNRLAIAAYNAGETAVKRYRGIPPYNETRTYVKKVLRYKRRYASLDHSGA
jgi:soluble lytic murein transglycosylase-like protein